MSTKAQQNPLRASELDRFERNLEQWLKLDPTEAAYHRLQGSLESQIVTLQICGVITSQGAVTLHTRMGEAMRDKSAADDAQTAEKFKLI
ncbi:hypothetical protein [Aeromonas salmonicida]|uniref:Uncharacterized protein n=1 Tax=Aeromonas salmonicida TaxID=645 RepID=A0AAX3VW19_AERSA|nr:hypothetical protein [Aeromonas salmonicida]WHF37150.1 hypothetical protein QLQ87_01935 [Aeromonas salmonicida]